MTRRSTQRLPGSAGHLAIFGMAVGMLAMAGAARAQAVAEISTMSMSGVLPAIGSASGGPKVLAGTVPMLDFMAPMDGVSTSGSDSESLPDAPEAQPVGVADAPLRAWTLEPQATPIHPPVEHRYVQNVRAGYVGQPLNTREKVIMGFRDAYTPEDAAGTLVSAFYSHIRNGQPNYGTNAEAFAQRFGATAVREVSEGIFYDSLFAVLTKEDPRYYIQGPKHSFGYRVMYAITRPLVTRTDKGGSRPNGALWAGYAASAALALAYYPQENRNFHDAASNFGGSIGGAAVGFLGVEFQDDILIALHLKKKP